MNKPNFIVDPESLQLLKDEVGIGKIVELDPEDAGMVAGHIPVHPDTVYIAASGVPVGNDYGAFNHEQSLLAIEWVRQELNPKANEPECNNYRYVFGLSADNNMCIGLDVTKPESNPKTQQVGDHWCDFDGLFNRHFRG